jgi:hypothetical protein
VPLLRSTTCLDAQRPDTNQTTTDGRHRPRQVWTPGGDQLLAFGGARYTTTWQYFDDMWALDLQKASVYDSLLAQYFDSIKGPSDSPGDGRTRESGDSITIDLGWLDSLFENLPPWATGMVVFGIPGGCLLLCICSGLHRQRRRSLARKRAEARERANTDDDD